ncbi:hypothetical protein GCG54_00001142 [Colletotrichum gloeosporioides]|uniref:TPR domain-containing protein n=1 Tax=Colletotrichum gloeosporioides TaxID=474922 RepID=A0A8H4FFF0_COLGL|nr:uncharacterized protein GCG54_00001142 [Colletotrichum gloeosporioides]KAF3799039.1 hypothetical protein GCG54_00001142 [Colletotrichum gloeosporioides]
MTAAMLKDDEYFDLGKYHRPITTQSLVAQRWFDRGLVWAYGFNNNEASGCFEKVILADPDCAMGYWGLAYTRGPYYNKAWRLFDPNELKVALNETYKASRQALERIDGASPVEQALIRAIAQRYPQPQPTNEQGYSAWNDAYASAMQSVYENHGNDIDVTVLYTDALMNLTPWGMWDPYSGEPGANARTLDAMAALEHAFTLEGADEHPGLLHLHIHLVEMSRTPELAVPSADKLRHLVPDGGHFNHMPSHIDVLIGDYRSAVSANVAAVVADNKLFAKIGRMNLYTFYLAHNYHSLIYAAMLSGQSKVALENCDLIEKALPEELLAIESPPMADWLETFVSVRAHVLIRFGLWHEILDLKMPENQTLYCVTTATLHYARGVAFAATGRVPEAESEQKLFAEAYANVPSSRYDYPNRCVETLKVGEAMLTGELEYRRGNFDLAFEHLRKSIQLDDNLKYSEPWGWMQPTRHAYAALSLEQGHVEEAAKAYAEDLGFLISLPRGHQHPNNVWALHGYHECLTRLGRNDEARLLELPLKLAVNLADVTVRSSCYCRKVDDGSSNGSTRGCDKLGKC